MLSFQLVIVGVIASVAAYAPSTFDQWRQDKIEANTVDEQQPYSIKWHDDRNSEADLTVNQASEDKMADFTAKPSSTVYEEWRRDPPGILSQLGDELSEVNERMEDIAEAEVRPPIDSYISDFQPRKIAWL